MKIYDVMGVEKDAAWLAATWGVEIDRTLLREGQANFVLVELREQESGVAAYNVRVVDQSGAPLSGRFVGRHWLGMTDNQWPGGVKPDNVPAPTEAKDQVVFGQTDFSGQVQFGLGNGDYAGPGDGVTMIWVAQHTAGTDVVKKMGMMPNTNHRTLSPKFQFVLAPTGTEPLPPYEEVPGTTDPVLPPYPGDSMAEFVMILARGYRAMADVLEQQVSE